MIVALNFIFILLSTSFAADIFLSEPFVADYLPINAKYKLFFWLFTSRNKYNNSPLVIFLNGVPGCSIQEVVLNENGTFKINNDGTLAKNIYSFTNNSDVMYLDQPIGTGFSSCDDASRIPKD